VTNPADRGWSGRAAELLAKPLVARVLSLGVAVVAAIPLGIAAWLTPDASGHGTHTQLGLAPCTILRTTGWPCPMCGATTAWALMAHLRVPAAFLAQPFGAVLFLVAVAVVALGVAEAVLPRGRWSRLADAVGRRDTLVGGTILALMFLGWTWKVAQMRFGL